MTIANRCARGWFIVGMKLDRIPCDGPYGQEAGVYELGFAVQGHDGFMFLRALWASEHFQKPRTNGDFTIDGNQVPIGIDPDIEVLGKPY